MTLVRRLLHHPSFAIVAMLTLALGIGANAAIFSLAAGILLRPLPYEEPARLVMVWEAGPHDFGNEAGASLRDFADWRAQSRQLAQLAAYGKAGFNLSDDDGAELVEGQIVSANFFETLGVRPALGRGFANDDEAGVVLIGDGLWRRRFGADPAIVGKSVTIAGEPYTVAGVMPRGFRAPERAELWLSLAYYTGNWRVWRSTHQLRLVGRLAQGATAASAAQELDTIARAIWAGEEVGWQGWSVRTVPLTEQFFGNYRRTVIALWIAVALVLAITCANLANLLLVRGLSRTRELAIRAALGASKARIIGELLAESLVIALAGGVLGIALASGTLRIVTKLLPPELTHLAAVGVDGSVVAYAMVIAAASGLLFGLIPSWRVARTDVRALLGTGRATTARARAGFAFVAVQVAFSVPLVAGSLLMARTMANLGNIHRGVQTAGVLTFRVTPSPATYREPAVRGAFFARAEEALRALPGVERVGMASNIPFSRLGTQTATSVFVEGRDMEDARERGAADVRSVSPGMFAALGMTLLRGRWLDERDLTASRVAVINESMARRLWPNGDPIGARIVDGNESDTSENRWFTVVGIVGDAHSGGLLREPVPEVYLPYTKRPPRAMTFVTRGGDASAARAAIAKIDPRQPIFEVASLETLVGESVAGPRLAFLLFAALGVLALLLATVGTYGVVAYTAGLRRPEYGIRASLGATPANLGAMIVRDALRVGAIGMLAGLVLARFGARVLGSVVYGVTVHDLTTMVLAALAALFVTVAASLAPARKVMTVNPAETLR